MDRRGRNAGPPIVRRLLALSTLYPNAADPRFGTFVARSMEALAERGDWDVTLINPIGVPPVAFGRYRALKQAAIDAVENKVAVLRPTFPLIPRVGGRFNPALIAWAVLPRLQRLHAARPFDVLDAQFFYPDGPAVARIARALRLPFSIKARGADIHYWGQQSFARRDMLQASRDASGLMAVSRSLAEDMGRMGMPHRKIIVHHTGLDRDRFCLLDRFGLRARLGTRLGIPLRDDEPLLASVGALIPRKGQDLAIRALAFIPDARLLLVGKGPEEARLRDLALACGVGERVHILGAVDHDLLPVILSSSDVMVLPSASEGLANAWIESLACGTPLVICDAGGAREVVRSEAAGMIVERTAEAVAEGIARLLASPPPRDAVARSVDRFDWTSHAETLAAHYAAIARR